MTAPREDRVFRYMPAPYRRAGKETVLGALTDVVRQSLEALDRDAEQVLMGAYLRQAADLEDAAELAALFDARPFPEESLLDFRWRALELARLHLSGPTTALTLLKVVGLALNAEMDGEPTLVPPDTTSAEFKRRSGPGRYRVSVIDAPPAPLSLAVHERWNDRACWSVANNTFESFFPPTYPQPIFDLEAGEEPLIAPILCQQSQDRYVLINRVIPPGALLRVDLRSGKLTQGRGPACLKGPVDLNGSAPDLLYGRGSQVGERLSVSLRTVTWSQTAFSESLLGSGESYWQLLMTRDQYGRTPSLDERLPAGMLRAMPVTPPRGAKITCCWYGRVPGTFTVRFGDELTGERPQDLGPRREAWLSAQLNRLRPAGSVYLPPEQLDIEGLPDLLSPAPELWLRETTVAADRIETRSEPHERIRTLRESVEPGDSVELIKGGKAHGA